MKFILVIAIFVVVSMSTHEASVLQKSAAAACTEGDRWMDDCNECWCFEGNAICTGMVCQKPCRPGEKWQVDCNQCECDNDGNAMCTGKICPEDKECTPGDVWQGRPCETCWCSPEGKIRCTWLACPITTTESPTPVDDSNSES